MASTEDDSTPPGIPEFSTWMLQIEIAAVHGLFLVALPMALVIPDICGALEAPDGIATGQRAAQWFDTNVGAAYRSGGDPILTGEDCYRLRCSFVHQGRARHPKMPYERVMFAVPPSPVLHCCISEGMLILDSGAFVADMVRGARRWYAAAQSNPQVLENMRQFLAFYPGGLAPHVIGLPLVT
jgi:hypothetical protein